MTLIAAYIYRSEVHLFADSAVTSTVLSSRPIPNPIKKESSFGEVTVQNTNSLIEESAQKIYSFQNRILLTFSGNEFSGNNVLKDLSIRFSGMEGEKISELLMNYFKSQSPSDVSFIIVFSENEQGGMFVYSKSDRMAIAFEDRSFTILGMGAEIPSLIGPLRITIQGFREEFNPTSEELNVGIQAILQSAAQNSLSFSKGVGGFFNGAFVKNGKVIWSPDTIYLLCSSRHFRKIPISIVFKYNIKESVFVSSHLGQFLYLPNSFWDSSLSLQITEKIKMVLTTKRKKCESIYFSVIAMDRIAAIIVKRHINAEKNHIKLKFENSGNLRFSITSFVENNIISIPINPVTQKDDDSGKTVKLILIQQRG